MIELDIEEIKDLYTNKGKSIQKIADILKCNYGTIRNRMILNNINIRSQTSINFNAKHKYFDFLNEKSCYWAGFIAADGNVYKNILSIQLKEDDKNHLKKFKNNLDIKSKILFHNGTCSIKIRSNLLINSLNNNFSITPNKSLTLQPPDNMPKNMIRHYIRGYFDGDGHIGYNNFRKVFVSELYSGSYDILKWILDNIKNNFNTKATVRKRKNKNLYRFGFSGNLANKFLDYIYEDTNIYLDRKYKKYINIMEAI